MVIVVKDMPWTILETWGAWTSLLEGSWLSSSLQKWDLGIGVSGSQPLSLLSYRQSFHKNLEWRLSWVCLKVYTWKKEGLYRALNPPGEDRLRKENIFTSFSSFFAIYKASQGLTKAHPSTLPHPGHVEFATKTPIFPRVFPLCTKRLIFQGFPWPWASSPSVRHPHSHQKDALRGWWAATLFSTVTQSFTT